MNWKRVKAIGKLLLLFGTPLLVVLGLFGVGVYYGHEYRHPITKFEHEWLGLDVAVAPEPAKRDGDGDAGELAPGEPKAPASSDDKARTVPVPAEGEAEQPDKPASTPQHVVPQPTADASPRPVQPDPTANQPSATATPPPSSLVDPLDGDLAKRLETPVVVMVKVLVDDAVIEKRPDWIDYVQRTVSRASAIYAQQFGIELELASVGRWGVATEGVSAQGLLDDVRARPQESATVVVGFTARPFDDRTSGKALTPREDEPFNGSAAVVYANPRHHEAHLRTLLHELAHLFGALDITDPQDQNFRAGSWMSYAQVPEGQAPWIDPRNRERVLARKDKPFAPVAQPNGTPATVGQEPE